MDDMGELNALAKAIREYIAEAEQQTADGTWQPTWEGINEIIELTHRFEGEARKLHLKQHGQPMQDGYFVKES